MKIARRKQAGKTDWAFSVRLTSDVKDGKLFPSAGAAIAYAQMMAGRVGGHVTVYEYGDLIYTASVLEDGTVVGRAA